MFNLPKMNKRGQTLELISSTVIGFLTLIFVIFVVLFAISALNPSGFFTAGSANANATTTLTSNLTTGVSSFGQYIPTVMVVLGIVLVVSALVLLILYVRRAQMGGGSSAL